MIKNDRQYRITKAQAKRFTTALEALPRELEKSNIHPVLKKAQMDAMRSQYEDLREELEEYEELRKSVVKDFPVQSFNELPRTLIRARIAAGLSQRDLAEHLGLKEQQIQRYEATEYASASLARINEVVQALGIDLEKQVFVQKSSLKFTKLLSKLNKLGLPRDFVLTKLLPKDVAASLERTREGEVDNYDALALRAGSIIGALFGWSAEAVFGSTPLVLNASSSKTARFKITKNTNATKISAYTLYTFMLAQHLLDATSHLLPKKVPTDADSVRKSIVDEFGALTFQNALKFVWSLGIPILPLNDSGNFHGACWRVDGRNVIVLKQRTLSSARWLVDLIHELCHAGQDSDEKEFAVIEEAESAKDWLKSQKEQDAVRFSGDVLLGGRAEELAQLCVQKAKGKVSFLKSVVPAIASAEKVPVGVLANYMAFRLSLQDLNWWGAANNLQPIGENPWQIARDVLMVGVDLNRLNQSDRDLLLRALT